MSLLRRSRPQPPRPPLPPDNLLSGLGPGDYWEVGSQTVSLIERTVGVRRSDRVLDVGCGLGRIAWPLARRLGRRGSYTGLDAAGVYIDWCRSNLALDPQRFTFHHADLRSTAYNTHGTILPEEFTFPWTDGSFDLTVATSIFTHLLPGAVERYLGEIARTLRPGGRLYSSFFLLDDEGKRAVAAGFTYPTFTTPIEHGIVHDPEVPEDGVAYDPDWVFSIFAAAGLEVTAVHSGHWKEWAEPDRPTYQDLVLAVRSPRKRRWWG